MRSPSRLFSSWLDLNSLEVSRREIQQQLSLAWREPILLEPLPMSGGLDRTFFARTRRWHSEIIAGVRITSCVARPDRVDLSLPRRRLLPTERLSRECCAYQRLSPDGLSPELLARGPSFLANRWLPWPRMSELLRNHGDTLWSVLPVVLDSVTRMHELGVAHLDLNCGNLLVSPELDRVALIDFEFAPARDVSFADQRRFDLLRLAHNLLKPRRGRAAALRHPQRFAAAFVTAADGLSADEPCQLDPRSFARIFDHPRIGGALAEAFEIELPSRTVK